MRKYMLRFVLGILLGVAFGWINASYLWVTNTMVKRMSPNPPTELIDNQTKSSEAQPSSIVKSDDFGNKKLGFKAFLNRADEFFKDVLDPWLPRLGRELTVTQVIGTLLIFPLLAALRGFVGYLSSYCLAWASERMVNNLRCDVVEKIMSLSLDFFHRTKTGDLITRVNGDTSSVQTCLNDGIGDLVKEPVTVVSIVIGLFIMDWQLALYSIIFFPLCVIPIVILGRKARKAAHSYTVTTVTQSSLLVEILYGIKIIKAYCLEEFQFSRFKNLSDTLVSQTMRGIRARELINPLIEVISLTGFALLLILIAYLQRSFANMVTFLFGVAFIYTPIKKLARVHIMFKQASIGVNRLRAIFSETPTIKEPISPKKLGVFQKVIEFRNVNFGYNSNLVLKNIDFELRYGEKLGVAGKSGSGKSTLANLLLRFYDPVHGRIMIDGIDIRELSIKELRSQIALVSQETVLFDLSVRDNIALGKPGATFDEVVAAAKAAAAHDFIVQLPQGYDTMIGERGFALSGGERQRIAIARAFIKDAPILVLDEATASLDSKAEAVVQAAIDRLAQNRTVICIAHRLSTLANMDRIIVLVDGEIKEMGTFKGLINNRKVFYEMAQMQALLG